ncbi:MULTISPECIES: methyl-accepting chemotaxis protein [Clostridium]|uniref:Predicted methyl-accepting chemotaxis sensory transducer n=4 Tax=Clostridium TaxID=1485 RepID=D8GI50_CLOLD|nr:MULTISPECIES: methyl-accepting chemotaxis protein [Clostridium]ADK14912.1 predicted methyl-accepting chemotaxis sensory transducer [Clostridium ljungdahlii DSM 13528]AGY78158.1 methyl-accepting chemotaxis protein [Clostridium autoethanogenum DSM 10061]ALU38291.1 Methyl-accepting chemotaxis sensory transducer [Clostridium autoethanogenum DSM 10061]OAA87907.1 putative sensory transducer protein YfmS [Clostridium ljungdahlii DSM 13528]OAA94119.1 putative sensory transducer protein YfmS [Clostr
MISINGVKYVKDMCQTQADMIPGGVIYLTSDGTTYTWRKASKEFDLNIFQVGEKLNSNSITGKAMSQNKMIIENVPRSLYGMRLKIVSEPIVNDEGQTVGVFSTVFPVQHPLMKAFDDFAPILSEMFSDGAIIFTTDLNKFISIQDSKDFKLSQLKVGDNFKKDTTVAEAVKTRKPVSVEHDDSMYGVPVLSVCYPLFSDDTGELIGTFGLMIPKVEANNLKEMSRSLEDSLAQITSTIEELAASASTIHENEQNLNNSINEITDLSQEINGVASLIKGIADQTKMLGLNASIEAARAGDAGKGFGVVAQEIRKLSEQSRSTVPKIAKLTDNIKEKVESSSKMSQDSLTSSQEQAAAAQEITASIEEVTSMSEKLNEISLKL